MDDFEDDRDWEPPWERKKKRMDELGKAKWTFGTLLALFQGLEDRSEDVRRSAMASLMEIALSEPEPVKVSPLQMMMEFFYDFTKASNTRPVIFEFLLKLHTDEADHYLELLLNDKFGNGNVDDYAQFINLLANADRPDLVAKIDLNNLPKRKKPIAQRLFKPRLAKGPETLQ